MKSVPLKPLLHTLAESALALLAVGVFTRAPPLPPEDPFCLTLVILPLFIAAFRGLERHAPRDHARRDKAALGLEGVALGGLLLMTLTRRSFGLAVTDGFLAAGYLLLLAHGVGRILLLWRPALAKGCPAEGRLAEGRRPTSRPHIAFFLLPLLVYLVIQPWQGGHRQVDGDEPYYLLLTHSLAHDFDADLANNYAREDWRTFMDREIEPQPGDPRGPDGEIYSRHNMLLPLMLVPAYLLAGRWGAMAVIAACAAALAWMVLRLALRGPLGGDGKHGARPGGALLAYAVVAFSPPLLVYSYQIWIEVPAALMVVVAFDRIKAMADEGPKRKHVLILVALLVLLPLLKLRLGLVALPLAALALYQLRPPRSVALFLAGALGSVFGGILVHNQLRYDNLLKIHRLGELNLYASSLGEYARGGIGMFYDVAFGLFPSAPIWFLLIPAVWLLIRRRGGQMKGCPDVMELTVVTLPYLVALAPRFEWYGAWSPPFRYPLVFLPLFALILVPLLELRHRPGMRVLLASLGALTLLLTVVWVVIPGWVYNFANGRTHLLDDAGVRLGVDLARFFPSTVRPRLATWIWPPLSLLLIPLALWVGPGGRRRAGPGGSWRAGSGGRRRAGAAAPMGLIFMLSLVTALPLVARHWPTRIIEVEDGWVSKEKGALFPDTWILQRPRYPSGWTVPPRGRLQARVVAGGETVRLRITLGIVNPNRPACLRVAAGEVDLATIEVPTDGWKEIELGPYEWPAGAPLSIFGCGLDWPGRAAVNRVELSWE